MFPTPRPFLFSVDRVGRERGAEEKTQRITQRDKNEIPVTSFIFNLDHFTRSLDYTLMYIYIHVFIFYNIKYIYTFHREREELWK